MDFVKVSMCLQVPICKPNNIAFVLLDTILALLEASLQTPVLVPVPNCSISRCRWIPLSIAGKEGLLPTQAEGEQDPEPALLDALIQSRHTQIVAEEDGRWLLDYQTYTAHLIRDHR